jgi:MarR family transcriptional regulator, transcriptional regulator for hemolysin
MGDQNLSLLELGKMMHEVFRVFKKRVDEQKYEEMKISTEQFGLLHAISIKEEDVIQKDMAEMMGKDKSAILRLIDSLEEKELVRRVADIKDRRKNYLMVTKIGYRVLEHYMKVVYELMKDIQQGLSPSDIETFHKVVNHTRSNAKQL